MCHCGWRVLAAADCGQMSLPLGGSRRHSSPFVDQQQQQPLRGRRRLTRPARRPTVVVVPEVATVESVQCPDDVGPTLSRTVSLRRNDSDLPRDTGLDRRPSQLAAKVCAAACHC